MMNSYQDLLSLAEQENRSTGVDINTTLKEILHYDILYALSLSPLGRYLVFQGGTALRLCYQGNRYSEDLDFVCGRPDTLSHMLVFKEILQRVMVERYGLAVSVREPAAISFDTGRVEVGRWTATVKVVRPNRADKQVQKIRIEVVNVPSYDNEALVLSRNYHGLAPGYDSILLRVSSLKEIMADKVAAVAGRNYLKARDLWDLKWMMNKAIEVDYSTLQHKLSDYGETDGFVSNMNKRLEILHSREAVDAFQAEMSRFLPASLQQQMSQVEHFSTQLVNSVAGYLEQVLAAYQGKAGG